MVLARASRFAYNPPHMNQWNKLLKSLGLSDSEANIYLISLEMGPAPVQDIAKKANVSRVTTYTVIETLMKDGLMSTVQKGKKNLYVAESPERLVSFVRSRVDRMEATLEEVKASLNDLKLLQRGEKPVVKMFEGEDGIKAILDDMLHSNVDRIFEFANLESVRRVFSREALKPYADELTRKKLPVTAIYAKPASIVDRPNIDLHVLPEAEFPFDGDIVVYGNKVAFFTFRGKLLSVLIESEDLANTVKQMFRLALTSKIFQTKK